LCFYNNKKGGKKERGLKSWKKDEKKRTIYNESYGNAVLTKRFYFYFIFIFSIHKAKNLLKKSGKMEELGMME